MSRSVATSVRVWPFPMEQLPGDFVERLTAAMIWLAKYYGPSVRYCFCGNKLGRHGNARHPGSAVKTVRDIRKATR